MPGLSASYVRGTWTEASEKLRGAAYMPRYKGDPSRIRRRLRWFLAAFHRFVSRRDLPSHMYSDNGTNFRGADRELQGSFEAVSSNPTLQVALANDGV